MLEAAEAVLDLPVLDPVVLVVEEMVVLGQVHQELLLQQTLVVEEVEAGILLVLLVEQVAQVSS